MRFWLVAAVVVLCLGLGASGVAAQAGRTESKEVPAQKPGAQPAFDFIARMQKVMDAWSTLDPANAAQYYTPDPGHVYYDIAPLKYTGWAEYAEGVKKLAADYSFVKLTLGRDTRVHKGGKFVWATATWQGNFTKKDGKKEAMEGRWTVVWEKRGEDWLIVHEHFSVPLPPAPVAKR